MANWDEIDDLSRKILKKVLIREENSGFSEEYPEELTTKYKDWDTLVDHSKKALKYDANKAFKKLQHRKYRHHRGITYGSIAASIILLISFSIYFIQESPDVKTIATIEPGYKKATLTLSNGTSWDIRETIKIIQTNDSKIQIDSSGLRISPDSISQAPDTICYHTLSVPRGGEYNLILADGTQVWLNSESELRFPSHFKEGNRIVYCKGEVYFDVTHNSQAPFIVKLDKGEVTVLGTQFCTSDYESSIVQVTLVEGSVRFKTENGDSVALTPSQHLVYNAGNDSITIQHVDTRNYTAWKDNLFSFEDETLENIMHTLARWYDVNIRFETEDLRKQHFSGTIEKYTEIKSFLELFETGTNIKFDIQGKVITVRKLKK